MGLNNKVAIVTGGGTGIGKQISLQLAEQGAKVAIVYNSSSTDANSVVELIKQRGGQAEAIKADVASFDDSEKAVDYVVEKFGAVDILVNNAGVTADGLIMRMKEEDFDKVISVNLKGAWNFCKHVVKYMAKQRQGKIINISSVVGIMGNAGQTNYSASKAGVIGLTKSLAREVAKRGVCVNAIAPGFIKTKMTETLSQAIIEQYASNIPMSRLGDVEDIANLAVFLASEKSNYITGQVINVDGGLVMY
jgi:3-oxoacyl-[acyl-carrier protein] reductase